VNENNNYFKKSNCIHLKRIRKNAPLLVISWLVVSWLSWLGMAIPWGMFFIFSAKAEGLRRRAEGPTIEIDISYRNCFLRDYPLSISWNVARAFRLRKEKIQRRVNHNLIFVCCPFVSPSHLYIQSKHNFYFILYVSVENQTNLPLQQKICGAQCKFCKQFGILPRTVIIFLLTMMCDYTLSISWNVSGVAVPPR
jgi:hypothetical protein